MAVKDKNVKPDAVIASDKQVVAIVTAVSQSGVVAYSYTPGYRFQLTRVRSYCRVKAGTIAGAVKVSTRTAVTTVTFTQATEVAQTLSTTLANIQGSATDAITIEYTSDGTGALTNGFVVLEFRPLGMNGEI